LKLGDKTMTASLVLPDNAVLYDRTDETSPYDILYPFALEELLCRKIGKGMAPIVHLWRHPKALVMGLRDSRLPQAAEAADWLESQGYQTAVRNSGGAAVPLDLGVVNVSLLLPMSQATISHNKHFELMARLLRETLWKLTSEVNNGEVTGAFCPGEYDLSIAGKKFCGIAQRRQQHALSVQAFVIVEGHGAQKASLVRAFYDRAAAGAKAADYPLVIPDSMASLSESVRKPTTSQHFIESIAELLEAGGIRRNRPIEDLPDENEIQEMIDLLRTRYEIVGK
jgi:octanoyl-[GcvH]:protein N-octanoyltransferase